MNINEYIRDSEHIKSLLNVIDNKIIVKKPLIVQYPKRFLECGLSELSTTIIVFGLYIIIDEENKKYNKLLKKYFQLIINKQLNNKNIIIHINKFK